MGSEGGVDQRLTGDPTLSRGWIQNFPENERNQRLDLQLRDLAFKKIIYHFPFLILDLTLEEIGLCSSSSMSDLNYKWKMINDFLKGYRISTFPEKEWRLVRRMKGCSQ